MPECVMRLKCCRMNTLTHDLSVRSEGSCCLWMDIWSYLLAIFSAGAALTVLVWHDNIRKCHLDICGGIFAMNFYCTKETIGKKTVVYGLTVNSKSWEFDRNTPSDAFFSTVHVKKWVIKVILSDFHSFLCSEMYFMRFWPNFLWPPFNLIG